MRPRWLRTHVTFRADPVTRILDVREADVREALWETRWRLRNPSLLNEDLIMVVVGFCTHEATLWLTERQIRDAMI